MEIMSFKIINYRTACLCNNHHYSFFANTVSSPLLSHLTTNRINERYISDLVSLSYREVLWNDAMRQGLHSGQHATGDAHVVIRVLLSRQVIQVSHVRSGYFQRVEEQS